MILILTVPKLGKNRTGKEEDWFQNYPNQVICLPLADCCWEDQFYYQQLPYSLESVQMIVWSYNEDDWCLFPGEDRYQRMKSCEQWLQIHKPRISIIHSVLDEQINRLRASKLDFYKAVSKYNLSSTKSKLKIPSYQEVNQWNQLMTWILENGDKLINWPVILSLEIQTGGHQKYIVRNPSEMILAWSELRVKNNNGNRIYLAKFIPSYHPEIKANLTVRLMIVGQRLLDVYLRPADSDQLIIHFPVQWQDERLIGIQKYFQKWLSDPQTQGQEKIQLLIKQINDLLGIGCYAIDCVLNDGLELVVVEPSLKFVNPNDTKLSHLESKGFILNVFQMTNYLQQVTNALVESKNYQ